MRVNDTKMNTALILAAGEGTRLHPLTLTRAKSLLPLAGKTIIEHTIDALKESGITNIFVLVGKDDKGLRKHLGGVRFIVQEQALGTANAVGSAKDTIKEPFLCVNGDVVADVELFKGAIKAFEKSGENIIVGVESDKPESYGVIDADSDGRVSSLVEKPKNPKSNLINGGIYVFNPTIFASIEKTNKSTRGEYELTDSIMMQPLRVFAYKGFWKDVGRPWDLLEANEHIVENIDKNVEGTLEEGAMIKGDVLIGEGTVIRAGVYIVGPVVIGKDCLIGPNCFIRPFSAVGNNVHIGNGVEVKNSIIMDNSSVPHLSYVGDSIIGEGCNLGAGTNIANLRFDNGSVKMNVKGEKHDSGRRKFGAVIGDGVKTGINVSIFPGVKIAPGRTIGPSTIVKQDIE
jgi:UDP-N-acetylglucosamine diphosphorylase / glucose-1-phosphate thymidylyltransferase / UDP-N-acetylgalactosamine diphosphorylase / glucosamine-1-phosphate N-acetyltransferase / galactosamine-1-phosphate N-acetyltransferase